MIVELGFFFGSCFEIGVVIFFGGLFMGVD